MWGLSLNTVWYEFHMTPIRSIRAISHRAYHDICEFNWELVQNWNSAFEYVFIIPGVIIDKNAVFHHFFRLHFQLTDLKSEHFPDCWSKTNYWVSMIQKIRTFMIKVNHFGRFAPQRRWRNTTPTIPWRWKLTIFIFGKAVSIYFKTYGYLPTDRLPD